MHIIVLLFSNYYLCYINNVNEHDTDKVISSFCEEKKTDKVIPFKFLKL